MVITDMVKFGDFIRQDIENAVLGLFLEHRNLQGRVYRGLREADGRDGMVSAGRGPATGAGAGAASGARPRPGHGLGS